MQNTANNKTLLKLGGFASIYGALIYIVAIIIFLIILDYPDITDSTEKVEMLINNQTLILLMQWLTYVFFGLALIVLSLSLYKRIKADNNETLLIVATIISITWAILLIASGLIFNHGVIVISEIYHNDPQQALLIWQSVEIISSALSFIDGELLGGLWVLLIGVSALKANIFGKKLNVYAIIIGSIGIFSIVPFFHIATALFGIGQLIWFIWISVYLLREPN